MDCVGASAPTAPAQATLTVRTYVEDERADGKGAPVPSGSLRVTAEIPASEAGEANVSLSPGGAGAVLIVLQSSKEVTEETRLVRITGPDCDSWRGGEREGEEQSRHLAEQHVDHGLVASVTETSTL